MTTTVIEARGLTKVFGPVRALDGLDLEVTAGESFGFLGPNGAGKSTTIRILLDLLRPTGGEALVLGQRPAEGGTGLRARIGYLPGELRLPPSRRAGDYLYHLDRLRGGGHRTRIEELARRFDLDLHRLIGRLSRGNKQKVGIIQSVMHRPELLILDEPTSGLDPLLQREFHELLDGARTDGATVFMSSHVLSEVEAVSERVAIIRSGKLVDIDVVADVRHRAGQTVEIRFADDVPASAFAEVVEVRDLTVEAGPAGGTVVRGVLRGEPDRFLKAACRYRVTGWEARDRELDEVFVGYYAEPEGGGDDG